MLINPTRSFQEETEEGFTLIELLVVILIIGILAAIAVPNYLNSRQAAVDNSVQSDLLNAKIILDTWQTNQTFNSTVPAFTVTESNPDPIEGIAAIKVSDGTTLTVAPHSTLVGEYTITGTNDGGDVSKDGITFNSATGGF